MMDTGDGATSFSRHRRSFIWWGCLSDVVCLYYDAYVKVGTKDKAMPKWMNKKTVLILVSGLVIVVCAGLVVWYFFVRSKTQVTPKVTTADIQNVVSTADTSRISGDTQQGITKLDQAIGNAANDQVKQSLMIEKVNYLLKAKSYDAAIDEAKQATVLAPNMSSSYAALARAYELKGDKTNARSAYQKALQLLPTPTAKDGAGTRFDLRMQYAQKISELGS